MSIKYLFWVDSVSLIEAYYRDPISFIKEYRCGLDGIVTYLLPVH